jgi:hypothetical protein
MSGISAVTVNEPGPVPSVPGNGNEFRPCHPLGLHPEEPATIATVSAIVVILRWP